MDSAGERFPRRTFLTGLVSLGAVGALGWVTLPNVPGLMREVRVVLPDWATTTAVSAGAYRTAVLRPDLLAALPCFCGCVSFATPHRSLYDCFVQADGTFETHAAGCSTCQDEAVAARHWAAGGLSVTETRRRIIEAFGELGPSTDAATT
jgi:hypothetical protein